MPPRTFDRSNAHQRRAHDLIPGGAHTYAKGDDQYADGLAPVMARGEGCRVWDIDGNEYVEFGGGVRSATLGHAYPRVCRAAQEAMWRGVNFARPHELELAAAEAFLACVPSAEMVKHARAVTGRDLVAVCRDQPFFSVDDWFIGLTQTAAGVPEAVKNLTKTFQFNALCELDRLFCEHGERLACVILEAERDETPHPDFLHALRRHCDARDTLLIIDETISGFRLHVGGAQPLHGVEPDLSTLG